ncbi:SO_0444 family Cu/Zn efflux transporter [Pleionea sp. CnH1-48]|uniref:SO_0444 family Cu/Zn efflux transporter n=1 Tax=Pleionea sp. CnH1-48 TaxID=2954494 RepID=UPI00209813F4|nr:SO_0444 family Cu/Zn efflux transporter [Pleionea sp. CnH1-48]MCO7224701.1 SO_0444 family Cu/Zn efflux transporter [Pleionea sp. CnH1-48]
MSLSQNLVSLFLESAPWLLLGFFIGGLMKALIPMDWMKRQLGGHRRINTVKAALIGAPLPLCSCGVVPAALGLRRAGASKSSTVSFLVATPETGADSIFLSYALLGPFMAIIRPIAAICSAISAGLLVRREEVTEQHHSSAEPVSCCAAKAQKEQKQSLPERVKDGLAYSFTSMLADIAVWLIVGIAIAALIKTFVPMQWLAEWGGGVEAMLIMAIIGVPMYICASASTPIAAGFLVSGISPGAVLVFMLAGPATNIGTLGIIRKELGTQSLIAYLVGVLGMAFLFGILTNWMVDQWWPLGLEAQHSVMHHEFSWLDKFWGVLLLSLIVFAKGKEWFSSRAQIKATH